MANPNMQAVESAKIISGPYTLFNGSFILEFLEPPAPLNATYALRLTNVASKPPKQG